MSDWWTPPSGNFHTPQRPHSNPSQSHTRRYAPDELDAEDSKMADSIKFLPSFASSPAGKLALGSSPQAAMSASASGSMGSSGPPGGGGGFGGQPGFGMGFGGHGAVGSPQDRRSPGGPGAGGPGGAGAQRFSIGAGAQDRDSPRHTRTRTLVHQHSALGNANANAADEDMPPTTSLRDSTADQPTSRVLDAPQREELPPPPSLLPSQSTTSLHIFGPPLDVLSSLHSYLSQFGPITSYKPGPEGSNWYVVEFANPLAASYALRRHGDIVHGRYMLGFSVVRPGSTAGCTLVDGVGAGAGTPIRILDKPIVRKPKAEMARVASGNEYAWDETETQSGWTGWVSERLFGR